MMLMFIFQTPPPGRSSDGLQVDGAAHCGPHHSFSIQLLTKNPARRYKVAHAWRRRCLARPYAGTKIVNVTSDTGAYLAYLLLPVCSVMAFGAGIFTACQGVGATRQANSLMKPAEQSGWYADGPGENLRFRCRLKWYRRATEASM